jgi:hypothetical protein
LYDNSEEKIQGKACIISESFEQGKMPMKIPVRNTGQVNYACRSAAALQQYCSRG